MTRYEESPRTRGTFALPAEENEMESAHAHGVAQLLPSSVKVSLSRRTHIMRYLSQFQDDGSDKQGEEMRAG